MNQPLVSIIIPAKNAQGTIEKCILSLLNLDCQDYETIVVNDGSQDKTAEVLRKYSDRVSVITNTVSHGPSKARNVAAKEAKGEFLAFTDADCSVDKDWINQLVSGFTDANIAAVGGRQEIPEDETIFGRKVAKFLEKVGFLTDYMRKNQKCMVSVNHNPSCNVMYRKNIFSQEGGFLEGLWPGEDIELDYRLKKKKYKIVFNPKAVVYHYRPENLRLFLNMMFRYGWAQGYLVRRHGLFRKIHFFPAILFISLAAYVFVLFFNLTGAVWTAAALFFLLCFYFSFDPQIAFLFLPALFYWHIGFIKGIF